jgi:hypothetical protein
MKCSGELRVGIGSPVMGWKPVADRFCGRGVGKVMECARPLAPWNDGLPTRSTLSCAVAVPAGFKAVEGDRTPGRFAFAVAWRAVGLSWSIRTGKVGGRFPYPGRSLPIIRA